MKQLFSLKPFSSSLHILWKFSSSLSRNSHDSASDSMFRSSSMGAGMEDEDIVLRVYELKSFSHRLQYSH